MAHSCDGPLCPLLKPHLKEYFFKTQKKIDYKIELLQETRKGTKIMIKGSIQEENVIMIVNIYISQIGALQYLR